MAGQPAFKGQTEEDSGGQTGKPGGQGAHECASGVGSGQRRPTDSRALTDWCTVVPRHEADVKADRMTPAYP